MNENQEFYQSEVNLTPPVMNGPLPESVPFAQSAIQKKSWPLLPHDSVFAWIALLFGFFIMRYILFFTDGLHTTLCYLLLYGFSALYIRKSGCKPRLPHRILGAIICIFSFSFSLTASGLLHVLCVGFLTPAIIWRTHSVCGGAGFVTRFFPLDLFDSFLIKPFGHFSAGPQAISASVKKSSAASAVKTVLVGLLVTIPLTIVVGFLLASADSGIEKMFMQFDTLLSRNFSELFWQILLGIPAGLLLFGTLYSASQRKYCASPFPTDAFYQGKLAGLRTIPNLGLYAGITPICLLYLVYVISQTSYFLSAFAGKLPDGMIYSEYARRGFFELCAIAVINLIVILVLTGCAKKCGTERPKALTVYAVILCLFTLFIIATAVAKMFLYINAYGMTQLRIYTTWFMILLAITFLVLLIRQFTAKIPTAAVLTSTFIIMLGILCFGKPDARIAEYNIKHYADGTLSELDVQMLCDLSEDAYAVMAREENAYILESAGKLDTVIRHGNNIVESYQYHPDKERNISAQLLIQDVHCGTLREDSDYGNAETVRGKTGDTQQYDLLGE